MKECKKLSEESLIYTFKDEEGVLKVGGNYNNEFGSVLIENCNIKNDVVTFFVRIVDVYGKEDNKSKIEVYQFEKENDKLKNRILIKETRSAFFEIKLKNQKRKQNVLVFRFNNSWDNIIVKRF